MNNIGAPNPVSLSDMGIYFKDGELWRDREDFEYREWSYWIVENTGFTWDSETPDNFMGVCWYACSDQHHDSHEAAEQEALAYAKRNGAGILVRVKLVQRAETAIVLTK